MKCLSTILLFFLPLALFGQLSIFDPSSVFLPIPAGSYSFENQYLLQGVNDTTNYAQVYQPGRIAGNFFKMAAVCYGSTFILPGLLASDSEIKYEIVVGAQIGLATLGTIFMILGANQLKRLHPVIDQNGVGLMFRL